MQNVVGIPYLECVQSVIGMPLERVQTVVGTMTSDQQRGMLLLKCRVITPEELSL